MSDDTVMVQPVRTFLEGRNLVHPESEPYRVSRAHALELRAGGLVRHVEAKPEAPSAPPAPPVEPEPPVASTAPRRRGRPPKAR